MESDNLFPRIEVGNEGLKDQIRRYRIMIETVSSSPGFEKHPNKEIAHFDNYQLEGEMNMSRDMAYRRLLESKYSPEEASEYLDAIPVKVVDRVVYVDGAKMKDDKIYAGMKKFEIEDLQNSLQKDIRP